MAPNSPTTRVGPNPSSRIQWSQAFFPPEPRNDSGAVTETVSSPETPDLAPQCLFPQPNLCKSSPESRRGSWNITHQLSCYEGARPRQMAAQPQILISDEKFGFALPSDVHQRRPPRTNDPPGTRQAPIRSTSKIRPRRPTLFPFSPLG
jgi:hypothetical protein